VVRLCLALPLVLAALLAAPVPALAQSEVTPALAAPIAVYDHTLPQDGASLARPLTEKVALADLDQIDRLKKAGVRFDFDLLDASAFAPAGGYGIGHSADWPDGPDAWIARCRVVSVQPGLRFAGNSLGLVPPPLAWKDSLSSDGHSLSFFEGGFLPSLMTGMQSWYDRGVRLFEIDSLDLAAATSASATRLTRDQIVAHNTAALREALAAFRSRNHEAQILIVTDTANPSLPVQPNQDPSRLAAAGPLGVSPVFSTGEPQTCAQPQANLRRSFDIGTDDRVRRIEQWGVPLRQIDSAGFLAAPDESGSGVQPQLSAWKGAFLLSMARGGWVDTVYGNLDPIQDTDARWMARVQKLFFTLQEKGRIHSFGGQPGTGQPYGFASSTSRGTVAVVVNPGQSAAGLDFPSSDEPAQGPGRLIFRDAGFMPQIKGKTIKLGPGQMAVVASGAFAAAEYSFGVQDDVVIPNSIEPIQAAFQSTAPGIIEARIDPPIEGVLRLVVQAHAPQGQPSQSPSAGAGHNAASPFVLKATQSGRPIPLRTGDTDSALSEGSSWAIAEIDVDDLTPGIPLSISFQTNDAQMHDLEGRAYEVVY
jgi:hypothetical protein